MCGNNRVAKILVASDWEARVPHGANSTPAPLWRTIRVAVQDSLHSHYEKKSVLSLGTLHGVEQASSSLATRLIRVPTGIVPHQAGIIGLQQIGCRNPFAGSEIDRRTGRLLENAPTGRRHT